MAAVEVNQYGRPIVQGLVFGYLCKGRGGNARDDRVYRFGRTTKISVAADGPVDDDDDCLKLRIEHLGQQFGGLNRPERVVMWHQGESYARCPGLQEVTDMHLAWEMLQSYLRNHMCTTTETDRPEFKHEVQFGDNYFSLETATTVQQLQTHLCEVFDKLYTIAKK